MKNFLEYLKLTRIWILIFVAGTQIVISRGVIGALLTGFGMTAYVLPTALLAVLVSATVFTTAAAFVINDYFDIKIDRINRPLSLIVTRNLSKTTAMKFYQILTGIGVVLGILAAVFVKSWTLGVTFVVLPGVLWFYSASYKRQFLVGNLAVAFCVGLIPTLVVLAQIAYLQTFFGDLIYETSLPKTLYLYVIGFSGFLFLSSLILTIVKNLENLEGEKEVEARTLAIRLGEKRTKIVLFFLLALLAAAVGHAAFRILPAQAMASERFFLFGILLPLILCAYVLQKAQKQADFRNAAHLLRFEIVAGVAYGVVFYFLTINALN